MINFINTGLDDQILKSLNAETPDEDLQKAMNKQGLVQKEIQVKGKNGQVFTRKQWVKAGEDQKSGKSGNTQQDTKSSSSKDNIAGSPVDISKFKFTNYQNPDGQSHPGRKTYRSTLEDVSKEIEHAFDKVLSSYGGKTFPEKQLSAAFHSINNHSSFRDMVGPSAEQGLKDAKQALYERQKHLLEQAKQYTKWDGKKWVKESNVAQQSIQPKSKQSNSSYQHNGTWITSIPDGINPPFHGNETYYFTISVYDASGKYSTDKYFKTKKEAEDFIDNNVVNGTLRNASQNDTSDKKQHWTKASTSQEAKQQITNLVASGKSREDCMSEFKAAGVTWKESDNAGINWMRACMAMNKYLMSDKVNSSQDTDGTSQNISASPKDDASNKPTSNTQLKPDPTKNTTSSLTKPVKDMTDKEIEATPEFKKAIQLIRNPGNNNYKARELVRSCLSVLSGESDVSTRDIHDYTSNSGNEYKEDCQDFPKVIKALGLQCKARDDTTHSRGYMGVRGQRVYAHTTKGKDFLIFKNALNNTPFDDTDKTGHHVLYVRNGKVEHGVITMTSQKYKPGICLIEPEGWSGTLMEVDLKEIKGDWDFKFDHVRVDRITKWNKDFDPNKNNGMSYDGEPQVTGTYFSTRNQAVQQQMIKDAERLPNTSTVTPTHSSPLVINDTKSGRPYQVWEDNGRIYGSKPGKQNSRFISDIYDFSAAGFTSLDEVKDYIKQYF